MSWFGRLSAALIAACLGLLVLVGCDVIKPKPGPLPPMPDPVEGYDPQYRSLEAELLGLRDAILANPSFTNVDYYHPPVGEKIHFFSISVELTEPALDILQWQEQVRVIFEIITGQDPTPPVRVDLRSENHSVEWWMADSEDAVNQTTPEGLAEALDYGFTTGSQFANPHWRSGDPLNPDYPIHLYTVANQCNLLQVTGETPISEVLANPLITEDGAAINCHSVEIWSDVGILAQQGNMLDFYSLTEAPEPYTLPLDALPKLARAGREFNAAQSIFTDQRFEVDTLTGKVSVEMNFSEHDKNKVLQGEGIAEVRVLIETLRSVGEVIELSPILYDAAPYAAVMKASFNVKDSRWMFYDTYGEVIKPAQMDELQKVFWRGLTGN